MPKGKGYGNSKFTSYAKGGGSMNKSLGMTTNKMNKGSAKGSKSKSKGNSKGY